MTPPDRCEDIGQIRAEIDRIDRQVIAALGERFAYVEAAARFKTGEADVRAPGRVEAMLRRRRDWAVEEGLDPDVIEKIYRDLVD